MKLKFLIIKIIIIIIINKNEVEELVRLVRHEKDWNFVKKKELISVWRLNKSRSSVSSSCSCVKGEGIIRAPPSVVKDFLMDPHLVLSFFFFSLFNLIIYIIFIFIDLFIYLFIYLFILFLFLFLVLFYLLFNYFLQNEIFILFIYL